MEGEKSKHMFFKSAGMAGLAEITNGLEELKRDIKKQLLSLQFPRSLWKTQKISCSQQSLYKAVSSKWAGHHMEHRLARRLKQPVGRQAALEDESLAALGNTEAFTLRSKEKTTDQARSHHANSSAFSGRSQQKDKTCLSEEELFFKRHTTAMQRGVNLNNWVLPTQRTDEIPHLKSLEISDDKGNNRVMTDSLKSALLETVALAKNEHSSQDNGADRPVYSESSSQSTAQLEPQSASRAEKNKVFYSFVTQELGGAC
ncbi:uncharacterized protein LOC101941708 isoform X10 [Chrysemys picta bellii]